LLFKLTYLLSVVIRILCPSMDEEIVLVTFVSAYQLMEIYVIDLCFFFVIFRIYE